MRPNLVFLKVVVSSGPSLRIGIELFCFTCRRSNRCIISNDYNYGNYKNSHSRKAKF